MFIFYIQLYRGGFSSSNVVATCDNGGGTGDGSGCGNWITVKPSYDCLNCSATNDQQKSQTKKYDCVTHGGVQSFNAEFKWKALWHNGDITGPYITDIGSWNSSGICS